MVNSTLLSEEPFFVSARNASRVSLAVHLSRSLWKWFARAGRGGVAGWVCPHTPTVDFCLMVRLPKGREVCKVLDRLRLFVPFKVEVVTGAQVYCGTADAMASNHKGLVDLQAFDTRLEASVSVGVDGRVEVDSLRHPWESLPSSFQPMAVKVHNNLAHYPGVEIKCSPAKLLQGHNVFGPTSIRDGAAEMLALLDYVYPKLFAALDVVETQVWELDATYSARMPNQSTAKQVIQFLQNISHGHRKAAAGFDTTAYFGEKSSRLVNLKVYLKEPEFAKNLEEIQRAAKAGNSSAVRTLAVMSEPRLIEFTKGLLRVEATVKKRWLERREIPTNLRDLCRYQREQFAKGVCILEKFWQEVTEPLFKAFAGATMKIIDDEKVLAALKAKHFRITKSGKISHAFAKRLFITFRAISDYGWLHTLETMGRPGFYRHVSLIVECGVSRAHLQNLKGVVSSNVVPILRFIEVDFSAQRPGWYTDPVSQFASAQAA